MKTSGFPTSLLVADLTSFANVPVTDSASEGAHSSEDDDKGLHLWLAETAATSWLLGPWEIQFPRTPSVPRTEKDKGKPLVPTLCHHSRDL